MDNNSGEQPKPTVPGLEATASVQQETPKTPWWKGFLGGVNKQPSPAPMGEKTPVPDALPTADTTLPGGSVPAEPAMAMGGPSTIGTGVEAISPPVLETPASPFMDTSADTNSPWKPAEQPQASVGITPPIDVDPAAPVMPPAEAAPVVQTEEPVAPVMEAPVTSTEEPAAAPFIDQPARDASPDAMGTETGGLSGMVMPPVEPAAAGVEPAPATMSAIPPESLEPSAIPATPPIAASDMSMNMGGSAAAAPSGLGMGNAEPAAAAPVFGGTTAETQASGLGNPMPPITEAQPAAPNMAAAPSTFGTEPAEAPANVTPFPTPAESPAPAASTDTILKPAA